MEQKSPHMIIHPSPGMGHLIPLAEFAKRLVFHHNYTITFAIPITAGSSTDSMISFFDALPESINYTFLAPVSFDDDPKDMRIETRISLLMHRSISSLRDAFKSITGTNRVVALVVDMFGCEAFDVAREFNVPPYMFFSSTAMVLSLVLNIPKLHELYTCEFRDIPEKLKLPGCVPFSGSDVFDPVQDKTNDAYKWVLEYSKLNMTADGILLNTYKELEGAALKALGELGKPPIYPVGPLTQIGSTTSSDDASGCLKWLDNQPHGSVLFISFGSVGVLSFDQITELAFGLEMSGERFLWVVKPPSDVANSGPFAGQTVEDPSHFLPKGFLDRTKGFGLVVSSWAPQIDVLTHGSTGGFLTHCGWNSSLESIMNGVPLIAWPLYAEQKMNAVLLTEDLKIALRPKTNENGLIEREEIARVVKCLMREEEGKRIRSKVKELKIAGTMLMTEDGTSTKALSEMANTWSNNKNM